MPCPDTPLAPLPQTAWCYPTALTPSPASCPSLDHPSHPHSCQASPQMTATPTGWSTSSKTPSSKRCHPPNPSPGSRCRRPQQLPQCLKAYHAHRRHLTTSDGVAVYKDRIIVPQALRKTCLSSLHAAHQGTSQMTAKAEASIFWPGITTDIHATRAACDHCNRMAPSQAAMPPVPPTMAN